MSAPAKEDRPQARAAQREKDTRLIHLCDVERLTYDVLAQRLGVSRGAVSGLIRRARDRLERAAP